MSLYHAPTNQQGRAPRRLSDFAFILASPERVNRLTFVISPVPKAIFIPCLILSFFHEFSPWRHFRHSRGSLSIPITTRSDCFLECVKIHLRSKDPKIVALAPIVAAGKSHRISSSENSAQPKAHLSNSAAAVSFGLRIIITMIGLSRAGMITESGQNRKPLRSPAAAKNPTPVEKTQP